MIVIQLSAFKDWMFRTYIFGILPPFLPAIDNPSMSNRFPRIGIWLYTHNQDGVTLQQVFLHTTIIIFFVHLIITKTLKILFSHGTYSYIGQFWSPCHT